MVVGYVWEGGFLGFGEEVPADYGVVGGDEVEVDAGEEVEEEGGEGAG